MAEQTTQAGEGVVTHALTETALAEIIERATVNAAAMLIQSQGQGGPDMAGRMKAWWFQDDGQIKKHGKDSAKVSWYVGYRDLDGKRHAFSCGPGKEGLKLAKQEARRIHAEIVAGVFGQNSGKTWEDFRTEYTEKILSGKSEATRRQALMSLDNFARIVKPGKVSGIKTATVDGFTAARRQETKRTARLTKSDFVPHVPKHGPHKGKHIWKRVRNGRLYAKLPTNPDDTVTTASVNADLRNLKAALTVAVEWGYLKEMPKVRLLSEVKPLVLFVTPEHFAALYRACDHARLPVAQGYTPGDWWRAFLVMAYVATGWRVGQLLALKRTDVDLEQGAARVRADVSGNKAKRERRIALHPLAVEHLQRLAGFGDMLFEWPHHVRTLTTVFQEIQRHAGIHLHCDEEHEHTPACHLYGFHNLRKGFGTMNSPRLSAAELQRLMQHESLTTTLTYYVDGGADAETVQRLHVPDVLKTREAG